MTNGDSSSTLHRENDSPITTALLRKLVQKAIGETDSLSSSNYQNQQNNCELNGQDIVPLSCDYLNDGRTSLSGMNNQVILMFSLIFLCSLIIRSFLTIKLIMNHFRHQQ